MNLSQNLKQEQKLLLTNEMRLSLHLLQMPIDDLQEFIEKELEENPILEMDYDRTVNNEEVYASNKKEDESFDYDRLLKFDSFEDCTVISYSVDEDNDNNPFDYIARPSSLFDYLREQLTDREESKEILTICEYLIGFINEDGFITEDSTQIATDLGIIEEVVHAALLVVQDLQPWGIGAKEFRESLIIQLKKREIYNDKLEQIIQNHMELLADNKLKELAKILGISMESVQYLGNIIKALEPKPARGFFTGEATGYITPEAYLKKIGSEYYIIMNDEMLPRLNVNTYYQRIMKNDSDKETVSFMKDKVNSALSLIKGIEQRKKTIFRLIEKIIELQRDYLDYGNEFLKPMSLKGLAAELNLHESTVSRAVKDKYISIPRGTIKLKDLFTNGIGNGTGSEDISSTIIKREIERLIQLEDKKNPLSDQTICELLQKKEIVISRRTVAKYREELGIRASSKRKIY